MPRLLLKRMRRRMNPSPITVGIKVVTMKNLKLPKKRKKRNPKM